MDKFLIKVIKQLKKNSKKKNIEGMKRFAINGKKLLGVDHPTVRKLAKELRKQIPEEKRNNSAEKLWNYGAHETKTLAVQIATKEIGWKIAEKWSKECENWADVDGLCLDLLWKLPNPEKKALEFTKSNNLWKKRTGFALMAVLSVRFKDNLKKTDVNKFLKAIERESEDERNFIRKAVNWALRQIGKSTKGKYSTQAYSLAEKLSKSKNKTARWIGKDAYREFNQKGIK